MGVDTKPSVGVGASGWPVTAVGAGVAVAAAPQAMMKSDSNTINPRGHRRQLEVVVLRDILGFDLLFFCLHPALWLP